MKSSVLIIAMLLGPSLMAQAPGHGVQHQTPPDPCGDFVGQEYMDCVAASISASDGSQDDTLLAKCLADATAAYLVCVKNAPSFIPFMTAYNLGICYANKSNDIQDCHKKFDP